MINEIRKLKRRPHVAIIALVMPLLAWSVLSLAFIDGDVQKVPVVVVDYDGSELTRAITNKLDAVESVNVSLVTNNKKLADSLIKSNQSFATIIFEPDFTKKIKQGKGGNTDIVVNAFNMIYSKVLYKAIAQVLLDESKSIQIRRLVEKGFSKKEASFRATPITTDIFAPGNPYFNYTIYLLPGMLLSILQMSCSFASIWVFREEKETAPGRITPRKGYKTAWLLARLTPIYLLSLMAAVILFSVYFPLLGIPINDGYCKIILLTNLYIIASIGMGTFLSLILSNLVTAAQALLVINAPSFVFSGYTFPRWAMPEAISKFAELIPLTHYLEAFFPLFLFGSNPERGYVQLTIIGLVIWVLIIILMGPIGIKIRDWFREVFQRREINSVTK